MSTTNPATINYAATVVCASRELLAGDTVVRLADDLTRFTVASVSTVGIDTISPQTFIRTTDDRTIVVPCVAQAWVEG